MSFSSKRGAALAPETLVVLILLTAFLLSVIGLIIMTQGGFSKDTAKKYNCWLSSSLRQTGGALSGIFPDTCTARIIDEALDVKGVSMLLRDTWWAYGEGESDFSIAFGNVYQSAKFKVSQEITLMDMMQYLLSHKKGRESSIESSDYNYLQKNVKEGSTVCFDYGFKADGYKFNSKQDYYLYFADSSKLDLRAADKLIFTKDLKSSSYWSGKNTFLCYAPLSDVITNKDVVSEVALKGGGLVE